MSLLKTGARYSEILEELLTDIGAEKILDERFEDDYSGYVDISARLKDGRVFSYYYSYGSCSGCDEWEDRCLDNKEVKAEMLKSATFFDDETQYQKFVKSKERP